MTAPASEQRAARAVPAPPLHILLVSTYELGHQPLALAAATAALRPAGYEVRCLDLAVQEPVPELVRWADLIAISAPMHTAARLGTVFARGARRLNPNARIAFFGLYAAAVRELAFEDRCADFIIEDDPEPALCALADRLASDEAGVPVAMVGGPRFARRGHALPDRSGLPPLDRYGRAWDGHELRLAGYVEASRGCAHRCTHCPLTPVFGGRLRLVEADTVLADVEQQIAAGARHITFGDPDFLNAVPHSLRIVGALHARHADVTWDATIKVEHLIEHASLLPRLREAGCLFVTSAFESCNDAVLGYLQKGHTRADLDRALALAAQAGLTLRPTWVAFTPWGTVEDFVALLRFVEQHGFVAHVQAVQYALKLLLPPGSPLIALLRAQGLLGDFDRAGLTYTWKALDPRIPALHAEVARIVEAGACDCDEPACAEATFAAVKRAALHALKGEDRPVTLLPQPRARPPGLSEPWFCCAEPTEGQLAPLLAAL